jgi:transposase
MALSVRELTAEERGQIDRLAASRTAPVRLVQRARMVALSAGGGRVPAIAARLGVGPEVVRHWLKRFDAAGLAGLDDAPRPGRPCTYGEEQRRRVVAKARRAPPEGAGGEGGACGWTLDRLQEELNKAGLPVRRSQIRRILKAERVRWRKTRPAEDGVSGSRNQGRRRPSRNRTGRAPPRGGSPARP